MLGKVYIRLHQGNPLLSNFLVCTWNPPASNHAFARQCWSLYS